MNNLHVEILYNNKNNIYTTIESFLVLYVYNYLKCPDNTKLIYVYHSTSSSSYQNDERKLLKLKKVSIHNFNEGNLKTETNIPQNLHHLKLPVYTLGNRSISGLCAVCRELIKQTQNPTRKKLLGFKEGCLLAPCENSVWTKYCEIDVPTVVENIFNFNFDYLLSGEFYTIPEAISRFQIHMNQPVRVHNIYKVIQDEKRKIIANQEEMEVSKQNNNSQIKVQTKTEETFNLNHKFSEGYFFSLADLMLFPCFQIIFDKLPHKEKLQEKFPLIFKWLNEIDAYDKRCKCLIYELIEETPLKMQQSINDFIYIEKECNNTSLYKSDPKRYKPKDRIFTKQENIEESLHKISTLKLNINSENGYLSNFFDRLSLIEDHAFPSFTDIPQSRLERKKQQLENLACAVISLAKDNDIIVDFCSGSGHLGILLAVTLPKCHIIFLENKERSLARAQDRIKQMNLNNCSFYQSNIDYFQGPFNIGTSLHACGTATDIVLTHCIGNRANFVCCPCCYGSINPMPHISYPLSKKYKSILTEKDYLYVAHAADQFHDTKNTPCNTEKCLQGEFCMDVIDTDRKLMAEENGYSVVLSRLIPENCTTKNRLLIGRI